MHGRGKISLQQYTKKDAPGQYREECFHDISKYVPGYLAKTAQFKALHQAEGYELGLTFENLRDSARQLFLDTATWGLERWEKMYGVDTNLSLTNEQRREIIAAKIRGQGTTTKQMIEDTAASFSGGEVEVEEDNANYHFIVKFVGIKGIPKNMQAFESMLEDIKPAHLYYTFAYTYTLWRELQNKTWGRISDKTWEQIRKE